MKSVFISYSWDDEKHKKWVMDIRNRLEADGITTIIDSVNLLLGEHVYLG